MRKKIWKSSTLWATIWCAGILTYSVFAKVDLPWFSQVSFVLASAVVCYITGNKIIDVRHGPEMEEKDDTTRPQN